MKDQLIKIKEVIQRPENWTRNAYARDKEGAQIALTSPNAVCWCLLSAIEIVLHGSFPEIKKHIREQLPKAHKNSFINFNDASTHNEVIALLDHANERAPA